MPGQKLSGARTLATLVAVVCVAAFSAARAEELPLPEPAPTIAETVSHATSGAWHVAQALTTRALDLIGIRYKWGGTTPQSGLDCSGLVQFVFQQVTGVTLPRSAREMSRLGEKVELADLKPGDLVFFNTRRIEFSHVGIYLGDNRFIHAPRRGRDVEIATIDAPYWERHFVGARRLMGVLPGMLPAIVGEASAAPLAETTEALEAAD